MIRRPPRSTPLYSSAASDVYKRQHKSRASPRNGIASSSPGDWLRLSSNTCAKALRSTLKAHCAPGNGQTKTGLKSTAPRFAPIRCRCLGERLSNARNKPHRVKPHQHQTKRQPGLDSTTWTVKSPSDMRDFFESLYFSLCMWLDGLTQETEFVLVIIIFVLLLAGITWIYFV